MSPQITIDLHTHTSLRVSSQYKNNIISFTSVYTLMQYNPPHIHPNVKVNIIHLKFFSKKYVCPFPSFVCIISIPCTSYSSFSLCVCSLLILFPCCTSSLFCCCNDPISPQRSIKFHLSYRGIKRFQASYRLPLSEGHKFSKGNYNIWSIA